MDECMTQYTVKNISPYKRKKNMKKEKKVEASQILKTQVSL